MRRNVLILVVLLLGRSAGADSTAGRPPSWLLTTDWGMVLTPGEKDDYGYASPDFGGAGGLTLALQRLEGHTVKFAELQAMPIGGFYMARAGLVWGARMQRPYYLWIGQTRSTSGNVTTVTNTYEVHPNSPIEWVIGLDVAVSALHAPKGDRLVGELGLGMIGQHRIDLLALVDSSGTFGLRVTTLMFAGDKTTKTFGWRLGMHAFFDFKDHPIPLLLTFGLGPGGSFHIPGTR